jgi:hypothetical protein
LTKAITILALTCFLIAGAAMASILSRQTLDVADAQLPAPVVKDPVANRAAKQDRLDVVRLASASSEQAAQTADINAPLRQAFAASSPADIDAAKAVGALPQQAAAALPQVASVLPQATASLPPVAVPAPPKPRVVAKPQQKSYSLLSDAQIAGIKDRLRLSSSQEYYWPAVENALRAVARKINAERESNPKVAAAHLDPDSEEVQQLKSAAMPLLFQLREDQKDEVRKLARLIGLEQVAAAI